MTSVWAALPSNRAVEILLEAGLALLSFVSPLKLSRKILPEAQKGHKTENIILNQKAFSGCLKGAICVPNSDYSNYMLKTSMQVHNLKRERTSSPFRRGLALYFSRSVWLTKEKKWGRSERRRGAGKKKRWDERKEWPAEKNSREGGWKRRMTSDLDKGWTTNPVIASVQDKNNSFVQQQQGSCQCSRTASPLHCSAQHIPSTLPDLPLSLCSVAKLSMLTVPVVVVRKLLHDGSQ